MAESVAANSTSEISSRSPTVAAALPTTEDSPVFPIHQNRVGDLGQFAKPTHLRKRLRSPETAILPAAKTAGPRATPTPISPKSVFSPRYSSAPLTAAAAVAAERRQREDRPKEVAAPQQTPNPARTALGALLGEHEVSMSTPQDAPSAANTMSEPMATVAKSITIPDKKQGDSSMQTSPVSMSSFSTLDSTAAATVTANSTTVASPGQIGDVARNEPETPRDSGYRGDGPESEDGHSNKALTFPGPLLSAQAANDARRGISLPHSGFGQESPRSASTKKHKCPYCSTDFTRHHNLKSHLLTHSHEKPYMCPTCGARFRRLHDLKRHTKLHTGERPHICPKCNRSFARGDALARHNKGQGGCAGRRSSMGSFGGDDQYADRSQSGRGGDDSMDGLMYTGEASHEPENMDEDDDEAADDGRKSLPSIRKHDAPPDPHRQQRPEAQSSYQPRPPSTYPPVAARQSTTGGLYPPNAAYGGGSGPTSPSPQGGHYTGGSSSSTFQIGGQNIFSQGGITESPKPLSPGAASSHQLGHPDSSIHRNRSPSLTTQFQQERYGRRTNPRNTPPPMGLPPPISGSSHSNAPQLPSLPGLTPPEPRFTLHSQTTAAPPHVMPGSQSSLPGPQSHVSGAGTPSSYHSQQGNVSSNSNSHSSHGAHAHASGEGPNNPYAQATDRLWAYVQSLEAKVNRLQEEVVSLRNQLSAGLAPHR